MKTSSILNPEMAAHGKIYCKWGGFLNDFDKFDPSFFNISPEDAKNINPQERLFLNQFGRLLKMRVILKIA